MHFSINLNRLADPNKEKLKQRREGIFFVVIALLMGLIASSMWHSQSQMRQKLHELQSSRSALEDKLNRLENGEGYVSEENVRDLHDLTQHRIFWSEKLSALSKKTGGAMTLSILGYTDGKLTLRGLSRITPSQNQFGTISAFIDSLKSEKSFSRDFSRIEFGSSGRTRLLNQELMQFEVLCYRD